MKRIENLVIPLVNGYTILRDVQANSLPEMPHKTYHVAHPT